MTDVSKLRFEFKEVAYIVMAAVAYFTQLSILSNKIESHKSKSELTFQSHDFRLSALELSLKINNYNQKLATLPTAPSIKKEDEN
jgi:hypothetical protein